jgi:hypothetical protein
MSASNALDWTQIDTTPIPRVDIRIKLFLDKSSSMKPNWEKTIEGVKEYFNGLKGEETAGGKYITSLYTFADKTKTVFENLDLTTVDVDSYVNPIQSNGVSTALYDSLGQVLSPVDDSDHPFLVVVFTDGMDNSSAAYNVKKVRDLISKLEGQGNFTFVFMGASPDSWAQSATLGTHAANTSLFDRADTYQSFQSLNSNTRNYARGVRASAATTGQPLMKSTLNFYANEEINPDTHPADDINELLNPNR